jgi:hypothetical protein
MWKLNISNKSLSVLAAALPILFLAAFPAAQAGGNLVNGKCLKCHANYKEMENVVAGDFASLSNKAKSFQVDVGGKTQIVKFTPQTEVANVDGIKSLKKPVPVLVAYEQKGADLIAKKITAKPVFEVPPEQLLGVEEMESLVAKGPEAGGYTLIDSRPPNLFNEGHIPGAISIPFPKMTEMMGKLSKDKEQMVVFYCQGMR